jgi:hypothetical protein
MSRSLHIQLFVILSGRLGSCRTATVIKNVWKTRWKSCLLTMMKPERAIGTLAAEAKAKVSHAGRQPSGSAGAAPNDEVDQEHPSPAVTATRASRSAVHWLSGSTGKKNNAPGKPMDAVQIGVDGRLEDAAEQIADRARSVEDDGPLGNLV